MVDMLSGDTELFMLPFFSWVFPKTAQNLENYRYHLLDAARANAHKNGYEGAQYPWESADDGQSSARTGPSNRMEPVIDVMLRYMNIM